MRFLGFLRYFSIPLTISAPAWYTALSFSSWLLGTESATLCPVKPELWLGDSSATCGPLRSASRPGLHITRPEALSAQHPQFKPDENTLTIRPAKIIYSLRLRLNQRFIQRTKNASWTMSTGGVGCGKMSMSVNGMEHSGGYT